MRKGWGFFAIFISTLLIFISLSTNQANAGKAGVGVLNVPPQFNQIRLTQQDNTIRAYITVSDYNSWGDILSVIVILEDSGVEKARFVYKQYEDKSSYDKLNEFSEKSSGNNLLATKRCSHDYSEKEETVEQRCYLDLLFVFQTTLFTNINIVASDRGGSTATMEVDYSSEDLSRSGSYIIIPGINEPTAVEIPSYLLDSVAIIIAIFGIYLIFKKTDIEKIMRAIYGKR